MRFALRPSSRRGLEQSAIYLGKGDYDKAISDATEAIRLDPADAFAYSNRSVAWLHAQAYDRAIADCNARSSSTRDWRTRS